MMSGCLCNVHVTVLLMYILFPVDMGAMGITCGSGQKPNKSCAGSGCKKPMFLAAVA